MFTPKRPCSFLEHKARVEQLIAEGWHDGKAWKQGSVERYAELESLDAVKITLSQGGCAGTMPIYSGELQTVPVSSAAPSEREAFEKWVAAMEPAYADSNLERSNGGRGSYRAHNVAMWWKAWQARAAAPQNDRWIPVSEKLPEGNEWVLVLTTPNKAKHVMCWIGYEWRFSNGSIGNGYLLKEMVTHWQPLPAPPVSDSESAREEA
jgi:hypothetical protein